MSKRLAGIFPVLQTPLDADGTLDQGSLEREVRFCIDAGAHGLVYPAPGSELQYLTDRERQQMVEVVMAHMNSPIAEYFPPPEGAPDGNEIFWTVFTGEPQPQDGYIALPDKPGLGLDINWEVVDASNIT